MVTHALNGEYGHGAHRAVADTTAKMIRHTSDPNYYKESAVNWGTWTVKKLYLHQYKNHRIRLDWSKPLKAFKDETSLSVATRALKCHRSQLKRWSMERANTPKTDNRIFGLYFTTVGYDVVGNDIMEHVTTSSASKNASDFVVQGDDETD